MTKEYGQFCGLAHALDLMGPDVAVPFAAVINAVGKHLLIGESREELEEELEERAHEGGSPATA